MEKFSYCPFSMNNSVLSVLTQWLLHEWHQWSTSYLLKTQSCFLPRRDLSHADRHEREKAAGPKTYQEKKQKGLYSIKQQSKSHKNLPIKYLQITTSTLYLITSQPKWLLIINIFTLIQSKFTKFCFSFLTLFRHYSKLS